MRSARKVFCVKFQKELPGLETQPWPGELGQRIYENVSAEAWKLWEERMKMILNEYRLMPWQKEAQELVAKHMEDSSSAKGRRCRPATSATGEVVAASDRGARRSAASIDEREAAACASRTRLASPRPASRPARR